MQEAPNISSKAKGDSFQELIKGVCNIARELDTKEEKQEEEEEEGLTSSSC